MDGKYVYYLLMMKGEKIYIFPFEKKNYIPDSKLNHLEVADTPGHFDVDVNKQFPLISHACLEASIFV